MTKCKDCGVGITYLGVRCPKCSAKKSAKRKYQRQHIHRLKNAGLA